jgi:membrane protease YdiL (CAAX protease family)
MSSVPPQLDALVPGGLTPAPDERQPGDSDEPRWPLWMAPAAILLGFGLGLVLTIIVELVGHAAGSSIAHPTPAVTIASDIVFDLGFVVSAIYFTRLAGHLSPADFGFRRISWKVGIKAFVVAAVCYFVVTAVYASLFNLHGKDKLPSGLGVSTSTAALVAATVFVCVVAPIAEEFFFRGFLFGVLRRMPIKVAGRELGPWVAAVVVGILFGLAHTGSASSQYLVPLGFLGFVLCLVRWKTGSLYPCMALHSANNALALGVDQFHWSALGIIGLMVGSLLVIAAVTGPLSAPRGDRGPRTAPAP